MAKAEYFIVWRDTSGRGEKGMLRFTNEEDREKHMRECLAEYAEAIAEEDETPEDSLDGLIAALERGETVHDDDDRTEYEFI